MLYKYIKIILLLTVLLQASPKVFNSLGNDLETFQEDCKTFQKITPLPSNIKKQCKTFNSQTIKAFKVGYRLDPYADSDNINERNLNKYLSLLRKLDKSKENILNLMYTEAKKAREQKNTKYYSQLIENNKIKLFSSDYKFMEKHKDIFSKNGRYISHMQYLKDLEEQRKHYSKEDNDKTQIHRQQDYSQVNKQEHKITPPSQNTHSIIMERCRRDWGTNYRMVKYCVKTQQKAYNFLTTVPNGIIKQQCKKDWGTNYRMVKYCVKTQQEAKSSLGL